MIGVLAAINTYPIKSWSQLKAIAEEWNPGKHIETQSSSWHGYHQSTNIPEKEERLENQPSSCILFGLILYVHINNFSVMSEHFTGLNQY